MVEKAAREIRDIPPGLLQQLAAVREATNCEGAVDIALDKHPTFRGHLGEYPEYAALGTIPSPALAHTYGYQLALLSIVCALHSRHKLQFDDAYKPCRRAAGLACRRAAVDEALHTRIGAAAQNARTLPEFAEGLRSQAQAHRRQQPLDREVSRHLDSIALIIEYSHVDKAPSQRARNASPDAPTRKTEYGDADDDTETEASLTEDPEPPELRLQRSQAGAAPTGESAKTVHAQVSLEPASDTHKQSPVARHLQARDRARAIATQAQNLPAASNRLQLHDLQVLIRWLDTEPSGKTNQSRQRATQEMSVLSLLTGAEEEDLLRIRVAESQAEVDFEMTDPWLVLEGPYLLAPRPPLEDAFTPAEHEEAYYEPISSWISLPLPSEFPGLAPLLKRAAEQGRGLLFRGTATDWRALARKQLSELNRKRQSRITIKRIASFLPRFIADLTGDSATGVLCASLGHAADSCAARLYYFAPRRIDLALAYSRAVSELLYSLHIGDRAYFGTKWQPSNLAERVGSRGYPIIRHVKAAVSELAGQVPAPSRGRPPTERLIELHNNLTTYTVTMILWVSGLRAVQDPIEISLTDLHHGTLAIADKDEDHLSTTRIVWLPDLAREQLHAFDAHRAALASHPELGPIARSASTWLFYIGRQKAFQVTPALLAAHQGSDYPYRSNTQRHYLRTRLRELGARGAHIDAWLGHGGYAESAYGKYSCMEPAAVREACLPLVERMLDEQGWVLRTGLGRPRKQGRRKIPYASSLAAEQAPSGGTQLRRKKRRSRHENLTDDVRKGLWAYVQDRRTDEPTTQPLIRLPLLEPYLPSAKNPRTKRSRNAILTTMLSAGEREGLWKCESLPPPVVQLPRDESPISTDHIPAARLVGAIHRQHAASTGLLASGSSDLSEEKQTHVRAGQLLVSAILDSGLVSAALVKEFPDRLLDSLHRHDDLMWIDFAHTPGKTDDLFPGPPWTRRWFPTRLTSALILRWHLDGLSWPRENGQSASALVLEYLAHIGVHFTNSREIHGVRIPPSVRIGDEAPQRISRESPMNFLLHGANTYLHLRAPRLIADFASRPDSQCSIPLAAWTRVVTGQALIEPAAPGQESVPTRSRNPAPKDTTATKPSPTDLVAIYKHVLRCLHRDGRFLSRPEARDRIAELQSRFDEDAPPLLRHLVQWLRQIITYREIGMGMLAVSSAHRYFTAIAKPLLVTSAHLSESQLAGEDDGEALVAAYDNAIAFSRSPDARTYASGRIAEFHHYLSGELGTPSVTWRGQSLTKNRRPNANLISETEYQLVRASLARSKLAERDKALLNLLLVLGYRLGLRRDEIAGRQLNCLQGFDWTEGTEHSIRPQLWIHATAKGTLKRSASNRRLPLAHLLASDELDLLMEWAQRRRNEVGEGGTGTEMLFTAQPGSSSKLRDGDGFEQISELIRKVSGDSSLDFHNLRHSFVSLTTLRLLSRSNSATEHSNHTFPTSLVPPSELEGRRLLKRLLLADEPPRKTMYLVSALTGHIDPRETLGTYCHSCDLLLNHYLEEASPPIASLEAGHLLGQSAGAQRVARHRKRLNGQPDDPLRSALETLIKRAERRRIFTPLPLTTPASVATLDRETSDARTPNYPSLQQVYRLLRSTGRRESLQQRAEAADIPLDLAKRLAKSARFLARDVTSSFRDPSRRRSRATRRVPTDDITAREIDHRQAPEHPGLARALPKQRWERTEAQRTYVHLMDAIYADPALLTDIKWIYTCSSRSTSGLTITRYKDVDRLKRVLEAAGIGQARLNVEVGSVVKEGTHQARREVARTFGIPLMRVSLARALRSRSSATEIGPLRVKLLPPPKNDQLAGVVTVEDSPRACYGWLVGIFYVLVCAQGLGLASRTGRVGEAAS